MSKTPRAGKVHRSVITWAKAARRGATKADDLATLLEKIAEMQEPDRVLAERLHAIITSAADELGLRHLNLPSGAGHDAQELARIAPMGMIFVPSVDGISHSPKERSRPEDIASGANVLLQAVLRLDQGALERP